MTKTDKKQPVVLLVESEHMLLATLQDELEGIGIRVEPATLGEEALRKIQNTQPNVILLDITLPDMDGIQLIKQIKAPKTTRDIPLIVFSDIGDEYLAHQAIELGAVSNLIKTRFTLEQVRNEIRNATGIFEASEA